MTSFGVRNEIDRRLRFTWLDNNTHSTMSKLAVEVAGDQVARFTPT